MVDPTVNTIICHPEEEETMICTQSTSWIEYILAQGHNSSVADMFSSCGMFMSTYRYILECNYGTCVFIIGEVTQVCNRLDIACICIQRTVESAERVQGFIESMAGAEGCHSQENDGERENSNIDDEGDKRDNKKENNDERENQEDKQGNDDEEGYERENKEDKREEDKEKDNEREKKGGGDSNLKTSMDTEELLEELSALEKLDSNFSVKPQSKHLGLKRFNTRSKAKAQDI